MTAEPNKNLYKQTLNLPKTDFPMQADLTKREPVMLERWEKMDLYKMRQEMRDGSPKWVLHDGPPFANGDIHIGHVINKTLKDVFIRTRSMLGFCTPYVPGWDCHGLPIEHKIQQELGPKLRQMSILEVRKLCHEYAQKYVTIQSKQFQRLGIMGDWANPYMTMAPGYEADALEVFARFVESGLVYKQLKPVPWSVSNQTALADAELEYQDVEDTSVYVIFEGTAGKNLLIWTTTPWTLPANLAVAVHPDVEYGLYETEKGPAIIAVERAAAVLNPDVTPSARFTGRELEGVEYRHPFMDRVGKVVLADYVTTTDGSGLVHTAPGHGEDDYETGVRNKLEVYSPVLANGRFDDTVPEWITGKTVWESNPIIIERLRTDGRLLAEVKILHSYPHDWRSKKPIIFRATEQWFVAMGKPYGDGKSLRDRARDAAKSTSFIPDWGQHRLLGMLEHRPDWCISRQRAWGLPIPVFYNEKGEALLTPQSVRTVAKRFAEAGSDAWFTDSPAQLLGGDFRYPPGFSPDGLRKEQDIFDVWFESGSSWNAVLRKRPSLSFPSDLYLEGSDQHRGWFQLSLLASLGATGQAPFKQVLTHGFIVKPDGTKVSKSDKEYVTATQEIERHGADVLRLWCCSVDYQGDVPASPQALKEFADKYRKIRNTLRYLLSNLYDFDPARNPEIPTSSLDGWAMSELDVLIVGVKEAYEKYELHRAFRQLHDFCAVQISAVYGNAMKDRLYCEAADSPLRRRCQAVMYRMALVLTKLLAPMVVFTADEAWEQLLHKPAGDANLPSVHLALFPEPSGMTVSDEQREEWKLLLDLRDQAMNQITRITQGVKEKENLGYKALDAEVIFKINDDGLRRRLQAYGPDLEDLVGAGHHTFAESEGAHAVTVQIVDTRDRYKACARSWKRRPDVGQDAQYPDLSVRDAQAVRKAAP